MSEDTKKKPDLDGLEMHRPENGTVVEDIQPGTKVNTKPILILLTLLLLAVLAGMAWWYMELVSEPEPVAEPLRPTAEENNEPESTTAEAAVETTQAVSTSDELSAIEADLNGTDLEAFDAELLTIENELNSNLSQ